MSLLSKEQLKNKISECSETADEAIIASAFITDQAVHWLHEVLPDDTSVLLLCRARPFDLLNGASTISSLKRALDYNWRLMINQDLHAKIYLFDKTHCFVGSSNLTSNGLVLAAMGNIEANTYFLADESSLLFIDNLINNCRSLSYEDLSKMEQFLQEIKKCGFEEGFTGQYWPDDIIQEPYKEIFSVDFPLQPYGKNRSEANRFREIDFLVRRGDFSQARTLFESTRIYKWLREKVQNHSELYFGTLSQIIHAELRDDPLPYRKSIKLMQANLYEYIEYLSDDIKIIRPKFSQALVYNCKTIPTSC